MVSGTRFGPYEILALLGADGLGEVYRARDTKLGPDVALKLLPATFSAMWYAAHSSWSVPMQIEERAVGDVMVLDLEGEVTLGKGCGLDARDELLKDRVNNLGYRVNSLVNRGHQRIFLNLAAVPNIDSEGLGLIVQCYTTVRRRGGNLKLLNLTERVKELLSFAKLDFLEGSEGDEQTLVGSCLKPRKPSDRQTISLAIPSSEPESD